MNSIEEEQQPSVCEKSDWLRVYPQSQEKKIEDWMKGKRITSGKWLIFVSSERVDEIWEKIRDATEAGKLGIDAKVSTRKGRRSWGSRAHVICVYTQDWKDRNDVMRVRERLKELGITWKIPYKTDEDTFRGKYGTGVCKYRA